MIAILSSLGKCSLKVDVKQFAVVVRMKFYNLLCDMSFCSAQGCILTIFF